MTHTAIVLACYILWTMILLLALAGYRTKVATSENRNLRFKADGSDVPQLGFRLTRAQANCVESFAFLGGTMLLALVTNNSEVTDGLAFVVLAARLAQSITHIVSISTKAIQIRFVLFLVQFFICGYWLVAMLLNM